MSKDQFLENLAREARAERHEDEQRLPPVWDRLAAGELSAAEEAELTGLAETSEDARLAYEAFRPLDADFHARVVDAIEAQTGEALPASQPRSTSETPASLADRWRKLFGNLFSFERWMLPAGLAATAAATALLVLIQGSVSRPPALPGYDAELTGGLATLRSGEPAEGEVPVFVPGNHFELVLRPRTAVAGRIAARCFLARDGEFETWDVATRIFDTGTVQIAGEIGRDLVIAPGDWTLWAVVGRPGQLPDAAGLRAHAASGDDGSGDWLALRTAFRIEHNAP